MFYKSVKKTVFCQLCPHFCKIGDTMRGKCRVRENQNGKLFSVVYGKLCSVAIDPIEKKPLHHFLPGSMAYSIATAGCNLFCQHCQNWQISQVRPEDLPHRDLPPAQVVENAVATGCASIAYTYTEPTIFYEQVYDTAKLARKEGVKNIMVTNGFINPEPCKKLYKFIDAANIDLKSFSEKFYKEICGAKLQPVLESIKLMHKLGTWIELTNLLIPTKNDDPKMIKKMCEWIIENVGANVPLHFSRFFPHYKLKNIPSTEIALLEKAKKIAQDVGIKYVYIGNIHGITNTTCPKCGKILIKRDGYEISPKIKKGKCECGEKIPGVWS